MGDLAALRTRLQELAPVVVAFSGGADSAFLAWVAHDTLGRSGASTVTAVVFWWSLIHGRYGRLGYGVGVAFVFCTMIYTGLIGAVLSLADHALYAHAQPTLAWGLDPIEDQQRAGLLMWVPSAVIMTSLALALFAAWLGQTARMAERNERR